MKHEQKLILDADDLFEIINSSIAKMGLEVIEMEAEDDKDTIHIPSMKIKVNVEPMKPSKEGAK